MATPQSVAEGKTYRIMRKHYRSEIETEIIKTGLTLDEAQEHCNDPETSSKTCKSRMALEYTRMHGDWFDCYTEE